MSVQRKIEAAGFPYPETPEEWDRLALAVGVEQVYVWAQRRQVTDDYVDLIQSHLEDWVEEQQAVCLRKAAAAKLANRVACSDDFHSVRWFGVEHTFSAQQAAVVKILYQHWERGTPEIGGDYLAETVECCRIPDLFKNHPAWNTMIVPGERRGNYRLKPAE